MNFFERFVASWRTFRRPGYYEEFDYAWTMTIDLDRCTGCEACVTACQTENNTPIVGEDALARGRHMQWMRVERYWEGEYPNVKLRSIPMLCQHCDSAPCETVRRVRPRPSSVSRSRPAGCGPRSIRSPS